jgi:hypothetical protein
METLDVAAFKHVVVPIGVVVALGVARMITTGSNYLQHRDRVRFSLGHALWCVVLFLWFVGIWWIAWGFRLVDASLWSYFTLIFLLVGPCLMYLAATILLPDLPDQGQLDLGEHLVASSPAFFGSMVGVMLWLCLSEVWLLEEDWMLFPKRLFQTAGLVLFATGAVFPSRRSTTVLGALTLPLILIALGTVRAKLG